MRLTQRLLIGVAVLFAPAAARAQDEPAAQVKDVAGGKPTIELVFVIDTTGSMGGLIEGAKQKVWSIVNEVMKSPSKPEVRMGLVAYRDHGDAYVTQVTPITRDLDSVYNTLMGYKADGGGDGPEDVRQALADGVHKVGWSPRSPNIAQILFLVGDAPPHDDYGNEPDTVTSASEAVNAGILVNTIQCGSMPGTDVAWKQDLSGGRGAILRDRPGRGRRGHRHALRRRALPTRDQGRGDVHGLRRRDDGRDGRPRLPEEPGRSSEEGRRDGRRGRTGGCSGRPCLQQGDQRRGLRRQRPDPGHRERTSQTRRPEDGRAARRAPEALGRGASGKSSRRRSRSARRFASRSSSCRRSGMRSSRRNGRSKPPGSRRGSMRRSARPSRPRSLARASNPERRSRSTRHDPSPDPGRTPSIAPGKGSPVDEAEDGTVGRGGERGCRDELPVRGLGDRVRSARFPRSPSARPRPARPRPARPPPSPRPPVPSVTPADRPVPTGPVGRRPRSSETDKRITLASSSAGPGRVSSPCPGTAPCERRPASANDARRREPPSSRIRGRCLGRDASERAENGEIGSIRGQEGQHTALAVRGGEKGVQKPLRPGQNCRSQVRKSQVAASSERPAPLPALSTIVRPVLGPPMVQRVDEATGIGDHMNEFSQYLRCDGKQSPAARN